MSNTVCFVSFGPISFDPRLQKTSKVLSDAGFHVVILAKKSNNLEVFGFDDRVEIRLLDFQVKKAVHPSKNSIRFLRIAWNLFIFNPFAKVFYRDKNVEKLFLKSIKKIQANIVVFINYYTNQLELAYKPNKNQQVYYETYEYNPTYFRNKLYNLASLTDAEVENMQKCEIEVMRTADKSICVSDEIAKRYEREYGCQRPEVLYNCPLVNPIPPKRLGDVVHFYLQSRLRKNYGIETVIEAFSLVSGDFTFTIQGRDLFGGYVEELEELVAKHGLEKKVFIKKPCPYDQAVQEANRYDVGITSLLLNINGVFEENHYLALPNRFFVYAHAGLAQIIGDHPSMVSAAHGIDMLSQFDNGDPKSLAAVIQEMLDNHNVVAVKKEQAALWCKKYGAQNLKDTIIDIYSLRVR